MYRVKKLTAMIFKYIFLSFFAIFSASPLVWLFLNSFRNTNDILSMPLGLPKYFDFLNYYSAWIKGNMYKGVINSIFVSVMAVAILIVISFMASYALARVINSSALYAYFALGIMIPVQATLIPNFQISKFMNLYNTQLELILLYIATNLTFAIFISYAFMRPLPKELEESAFLDGCSRTRAFVSIIMPLAMPAVSTVGIISFLGCWNDYLLATIFLSDQKMYTVTMYIYRLIGEFETNYGVLFASMSITIIPVLIIYVIFQEQISQGMAAGAVKG